MVRGTVLDALGVGAAAQLSALLLEAAAALSGSRQELEWLTSHPLWLPAPLAPLFKALRPRMLGRRRGAQLHCGSGKHCSPRAHGRAEVLGERWVRLWC